MGGEGENSGREKGIEWKRLEKARVESKRKRSNICWLKGRENLISSQSRGGENISGRDARAHPEEAMESTARAGDHRQNNAEKGKKPRNGKGDWQGAGE